MLGVSNLSLKLQLGSDFLLFVISEPLKLFNSNFLQIEALLSGFKDI